MRNKKLNSITYGAIICALVGALLLVNRQLAGYFDAYLFWVIPLPVIIYSVKFDSKQAIIMSIAMLLLSVIVSSPTTIFYVFASICAGLIYGWGMNHQKSALFLIGSVVIVSLIVMFATTFVAAEFFGYMSVKEEIAFFAQTFKDVIGSSIKDQTTMEAFNKLLSGNTMTTIYMISVVLTSILEGILVHIFAFIVLKRLKMNMPPMKPIHEIYAPLWMKIFVFAAFAASIISQLMHVTAYDDIITGLMIVAEIICFAFGYIVLVCLTSIFIRNKLARFLITILAIFFAIPVIEIIGVFDVFSNFRKNINTRIINEQKNRQNQNSNSNN